MDSLTSALDQLNRGIQTLNKRPLLDSTGAGRRQAAIAIVMDDKIITVDMRRRSARRARRASEYIVNQMRETRVSVQ